MYPFLENILRLPLENDGYNKWPGIDVIGGDLTGKTSLT